MTITTEEINLRRLLARCDALVAVGAQSAAEVGRLEQVSRCYHLPRCRLLRLLSQSFIV